MFPSVGHASARTVLDEFAELAGGSGRTGELDGPTFLATLLEWVLNEHARAAGAISPDEVAKAQNGNHHIMDPFLQTIAPDFARLAPLRRSLSSCLELAGVADPPRADLVLATHEAAANAIEHGNPDQPFEVTGTIVSQVLTVEISDTGRWEGRKAGNDERGMGLTLIEGLVTRMEIVTGREGTTFRLEQQL